MRSWTCRLLPALLLTTGLEAASRAGQDLQTTAPRPERWTYWVDLGANFVGTTHVDSPTAQNNGSEVELDLGVRMDLGIGYRPVPWLRLGFETGYVWNAMDSLLGFEEVDGQISQVPVQAVVAVDHRLWGPLSGTIGGGAGGVYTRTTSGWAPLWRSVGGNQFVAGYQGFAGLTYYLGRRTHLGLHYRLAGTERLDWTLEFANGAEQEARTDRWLNHGVTVFFRADF